MSSTLSPFPTRLAPPTETLLSLVRGLKYGDEVRCHAIEDNAEQRCVELYKIRMRYLKTLLEAVRQLDPPFSPNEATQLATVLLCTKHRKSKEHMDPLVNSLTVAKTESESDPRRDSMRPLNPLHARSPLTFTPEPAQYDAVRQQLMDSKPEFRCIAYDMVIGRCSSELSQDKLVTARRILSDELGMYDYEESQSIEIEDDDGFVDEDESFDEDEDYCEDDETPSSKSKLRPLVHLLLCNNHTHWFWLDFYHNLWQKHVEPESTDDEELGQWSQQDYEATDDGDSDRFSDSVSDISEHTEGRSDAESIRSSPSTPTRSSRAHNTDSPDPASEDLPLGPLEAPRNQKRSARNTKQRSTPADKSAPSIKIDSAPSPLPNNCKKPRSSPRRRSSTNVAQNRPASGLADDENLAENLHSMTLSTTTPTKPQDTGLGHSFSSEIISDGSCAAILPYEAVRQVEENLCTLLLQPVGPQKKKSTANIYVLKSTDRPGLVKIGITADLPINRCRQIKAQSGLDDLEIIHTVRDLENADRVERVIHCHLAPFNEDPQCRNRNYREWFRFDAKLAVEVVNAWAVWMQRKPYKYRSLGDGWSAKLEELQVGGMDQSQESVQQVYKRHIRWTRQV